MTPAGPPRRPGAPRHVRPLRPRPWLEPVPDPGPVGPAAAWAPAEDAGHPTTAGRALVLAGLVVTLGVAAALLLLLRSG